MNRPRDILPPQPSNPSPPTRSHSGNYAINESLVFGLFGTLFCVLLIVLLFVCAYAIIRRALYSSESTRGSPWLWRREDTSISRARIHGLDAKLVEALPTFVYTSQNLKGEEKLECTICLTEFGEGDKVRVLPACKHSFHTECIDMWFNSHSNCPVCRIEVEADAQALLVDKVDDACPSNGSDDGVVVNIGVIEQGQSNGGLVEDGSNKYLSPRESEEIGSPSASQSGRFTRLHSLKRMLSRGREEKVFPTGLHQTTSESEGQSHD